MLYQFIFHDVTTINDITMHEPILCNFQGEDRRAMSNRYIVTGLM